MRPRRPALRDDERGATLIEFAIIAPVMILLIMGLGDLMYQAYAQALLSGALQKAARDSALQGGKDQAAALDAQVVAMVKIIAPGATYNASRESYATFSSMKPEAFTDKDGDGKCDHGESFTDINGNKTWDADPATSADQGGAEDVVKYTLIVHYPRVFPMAGLLGWPATADISATTYLKNQPYDTQIVPNTSTSYTCK